jgi:hypothetical protein
MILVIREVISVGTLDAVTKRRADRFCSCFAFYYTFRVALVSRIAFDFLTVCDAERVNAIKQEPRVESTARRQ